MGQNIANKYYEELDIKYVKIYPKLKGGSVKLGFLNINGIPSSNKNLHKHKEYE